MADEAPWWWGLHETEVEERKPIDWASLSEEDSKFLKGLKIEA